MDKNEYNARLEEINRLVDQGNYAEAAKIADQIDWKRVRNVRTLCLISEIYEAEDRYEDSKNMLLKAYKKSPSGRAILYRLVEVTTKLKQFDEAIEYYSDYCHVAPHDPNRLILKYRIYRGRGSSVDEQIEILNEYLKEEYNEKYAYELAKLYQEADRISECLTTCDDLVLWFHSGKYVIKALELKMRYSPLTPKQQEIYDHRASMMDDEETIGQEKQMVETEDTSLAETILEDTTREIASEVAKATGMVSGLPEEEPAAEDKEGEAEALQPAALEDGEVTPGDEEPAETADEEAAESVESGEETIQEEEIPGTDEALLNTGEETGSEEAVSPDAKEVPTKAEPVRPITIPEDKYNTKDFQNEMLRSMREVVSGLGLRDQVDEDEAAMDALIDQSKQEQAARIDSDAAQIRMTRKLTLPELQKKADAGQISIDDVLLSMGDKGAAVRETVADARAASGMTPQRTGVLSAVDEALLNMGVQTKAAQSSEPQKEEEPAAEAVQAVPEETEETAEETQTIPEEPEAEAEEIQSVPETPETAGEMDEEAEEEAAAGVILKKDPDMAALEAALEKSADTFGEEDDDDDVKIAEVSRAGAEVDEQIHEAYEQAMEGTLQEEPVSMAPEDMSMKEVMTAKTRKVPTEKIAELHGRTPLEADEETAGEGVEAGNAAEGEAQTGDGAPEAAAGEGTQAGPAVQKPERMWLKKDLRGFFDGFLTIRDMDRQIAGAIEQILAKGNDKTSRTGNVLIFGGHGCGKTTIGTSIAKAIAQERGSGYVKMAKIYAADLNRKDIAATIARIAGGVLIVEEAGDLDDMVADQLSTALEFRTDGLILILEDEQRYIHDLLMRHPRLTMKFTSQIYIPPFTAQDLIGFAALYADDRDYVISDEAAALLRDRLDSLIEGSDNGVSITNVLDITDEAIARANKFTRKLFSGKKRFDSEGRVILQEKDFR